MTTLTQAFETLVPAMIPAKPDGGSPVGELGLVSKVMTQLLWTQQAEHPELPSLVVAGIKLFAAHSQNAASRLLGWNALDFIPETHANRADVAGALFAYAQDETTPASVPLRFEAALTAASLLPKGESRDAVLRHALTVLPALDVEHHLFTPGVIAEATDNSDIRQTALNVLTGWRDTGSISHKIMPQAKRCIDRLGGIVAPPSSAKGTTVMVRNHKLPTLTEQARLALTG